MIYGDILILFLVVYCLDKDFNDFYRLEKKRLEGFLGGFYGGSEVVSGF